MSAGHKPTLPVMKVCPSSSCSVIQFIACTFRLYMERLHMMCKPQDLKISKDYKHI